MPNWTDEILRDIDNLDLSMFEAIATSRSDLLDKAMPRLTDAADHSKLWLGIAGVLAISRRRRAQRAATRGVLTLAAASAIANLVAKRINRRPRPSLDVVPVARLSHRLPDSTSFPSGHSASAAAFASAVGMELPSLALPLRTLAGAVGLSRVATGAHYPSDVLGGWLLGSAVARVGARLVPPASAPTPRRREPAALRLPPRPTGAGLTLVVNPSSNSGRGEKVLRRVTRKLPDARVVELVPGQDWDPIVAEAAAGAEVLGVAGGDGTVQLAARHAIEADVPLAVFPAGTFNHFAKDSFNYPLEAAIQGVRKGTADRIDVAYLNDSLFLNTASIGAYTDFVTIRERYEKRIGKPLAALYAGLRTLHREQAVRIRMDDRTRSLSLMFIGNGGYQPNGFAPSFREQMDDGLLDIRMLDVSGPWSRLSVLVSLATGQLASSKRYHQVSTPSATIEVLGDPVRIARDGELGETAGELRLRVKRRALVVMEHDTAF